MEIIYVFLSKKSIVASNSNAGSVFPLDDKKKLLSELITLLPSS